MTIRRIAHGMSLPRRLKPPLYGLVLGLSLSVAYAQTPTPATAPATRAYVETLASDKFAGREAGSTGERQAGDYIAAQLARIGVRPLPGRQDVFMSFEFTAGSKDGGSQLVMGNQRFTAPDDVVALSFSDDADVSAPAVFAGYGIVVPESQNFGYDSYATLDVKDKAVVVFRYFPEDADKETKSILARYSDLRYKALAARQRGAKALLVVTGPRSPNAGQTVPITFDTALAGSGIPAASISGKAAAALFGSRSLESVQKEFDTGNPHAAGFALEGVTVELATKLVRERRTARNVVAYLPATSPVTGVDKPWIVIGAHYDHLGLGRNGNSLAAAGDAGKPHVGADDNASGSAAVLAVAEGMARQKVRRRNLAVALWSAEELGLIGSSAFVNAPPIPVNEIAAYLNFDMVGRMQDNKLAVQATGSSATWASLIERANVAAGFNLALQPDPYQPTDVATFNQASVPSLNFTTGAHLDYHKPSDTADKINYEDLDRIAQFATVIATRLLESEQAPQFVKVEQSSQTANRTGVRVFTGTVPDYAADAKGLLLGGVIGGGPAEQAGLQKGDVIVEIAGQTIANIYDYTYALELLKIGEPVKVVYMRGTERRETTLTPAARR
ncbi:MAG TPA: M28 family peptidase [Vicinamibacterales bacterium]|nr:M28 family peptidase [Vicinamibacterales bacterium]